MMVLPLHQGFPPWMHSVPPCLGLRYIPDRQGKRSDWPRTHGDCIHHHYLAEAGLTVRTHAELPQQWAATQSNLGATLGDQGTRTGGEAGKVLIRQAIKAFELALEVRTREALPVQWEATMGNLTIAKKALEDMK